MNGEERTAVELECRRKALDLLARRPHFRRELQSKLATRGFAGAVIEDTLSWLEESGYIDDLTGARQLVDGAWRRKGFGPRRMRAEFERRGVAAETISVVLAETWADGEDARAREQALTWLRHRVWERARLSRHLERKGFGAATIRRVVSELQPPPEAAET